MKLNNFDTVLIEFVYKEQLNKPIEERDFKYRPALILNKNLILEVVQISSKVKKYKNNKNCYIIKDLKAAGLDKPSIIRFNIKLKLVDINQKTIKKIGHLSEDDIKAIKEAKLVEKLQEAQQQSAVKSNGVYSVMKDEWIKEPVQADIPDLDKEAFEKLFTEWEDKYFDLINKENLTSEEIEDFIEDIYDLRKISIATEGEYSLGNLVFKECRNLGYLDNLKDLKNEIKSKELSLESLKEAKQTVDEEEAFWNLRDPNNATVKNVFDRLGNHTGNLYYNFNTKQIELIPNTNTLLSNKYSVSCEHKNTDFGDVVKKRLNKFMSKVNGNLVVYFNDPANQYSNEYSVITSDKTACDNELYTRKQKAYASYSNAGEYLGDFTAYKNLTTGEIIIAFIEEGKTDDKQLVTTAIEKVVNKQIKNLNLKKRTFNEA